MSVDAAFPTSPSDAILASVDGRVREIFEGRRDTREALDLLQMALSAIGMLTNAVRGPAVNEIIEKAFNAEGLPTS